MTKKDIVKIVAKRTKIEAYAVQIVLDEVFAQIMKANLNGRYVYFRGFGAFKIKTKAAKIARNMKNNTAMPLPAYNVPFFEPYDDYYDGVKNNVKVGKKIKP